MDTYENKIRNIIKEKETNIQILIKDGYHESARDISHECAGLVIALETYLKGDA